MRRGQQLQKGHLLLSKFAVEINRESPLEMAHDTRATLGTSASQLKARQANGRDKYQNKNDINKQYPYHTFSEFEQHKEMKNRY